MPVAVLRRYTGEPAVPCHRAVSILVVAPATNATEVEAVMVDVPETVSGAPNVIDRDAVPLPEVLLKVRFLKLLLEDIVPVATCAPVPLKMKVLDEAVKVPLFW